MVPMHVLTNEQIEAILKSEANKFNSFVKTIKYIYKSKSSEKIKRLLSRNINKDPSIIMNLLWELAKYFIVANELMNVRLELFNMVFNQYSRRLDDSELLRIINNPSNQWLDNNHKKIALVSYYLDELFKSPRVCEEVCRVSGCSTEDYHALRRNVINKLDSLKCSAFDEFEKGELERINDIKNEFAKTSFLLSEDEASKTQELYYESFDDSTLLDIVEKEE